MDLVDHLDGADSRSVLGVVHLAKHMRGIPEKSDRNNQMLAAHREGKSYRAIAEEHGISIARVFAIVAREKNRVFTLLKAGNAVQSADSTES
jgi:DNA-binding CsgD family transcriptional regulator